MSSSIMCDNGLDSEMYMDSDIVNSPTIIDTTKNVTIRAKKTKKNIKIMDYQIVKVRNFFEVFNKLKIKKLI